MTKSTVDWYQFQRKLTSNHESISWCFKTLDHSFETQTPSFKTKQNHYYFNIRGDLRGGVGLKRAVWGHITIQVKIKLAEGWTRGKL